MFCAVSSDLQFEGPKTYTVLIALLKSEFSGPEIGQNGPEKVY